MPNDSLAAAAPTIHPDASTDGARVSQTCPECGSDGVGHEATAVWNEGTQAWCLDTIYDDQGFCRDCDAEFSIATPVPLYSQAAQS